MDQYDLIAYVARRGEYITGGERPEAVAARWTQRMIPELARDYMDAGTFEPHAAVAMMLAGYGPEVAATRIQVCGTHMTVGEAVSNGDLDVDQIDIYND